MRAGKARARHRAGKALSQALNAYVSPPGGKGKDGCTAPLHHVSIAERSNGAPCPPVVDYTREFLARAAGELDSLPAGSAIEQMLADYQVMRDQARACERFGE